MKIKNTKINSNLGVEKQASVSGYRKAYDVEFRKQILEVWNSGAYASVPECAKNYGLNENTLYNWIHKSKAMPTSESNAEVVKLKKELAKAKMELEILKKAAIYFANHAR
jgi:transposase